MILRVFSKFVAPQGTLPSAEPGRREQAKARRRNAIIDSTLALLRKRSLADVSIEQIAARARVAPATVYNLFGTREQLLLASVDRVVESLVDQLVHNDPDDDPVAAATAIVELSAEAFIVDQKAFRQILGALGDVPGGGAPLSVDPAQLQIAAMRAARDQGLLRADADPAAAGRQVYLSYNGALSAWARHRLTDDGFRLAVRHALFTVLAAYASNRHQQFFIERLAALGPALTAAGWGDSSSA
jgi:AcrR family transcriptional regulator